ncbi:MAG: hypothetical protein LBO07_05315 [Coriobacteriales bacterium]|jgi:4-diphosphocytidyl-2-C-methyl-D-erythritol kinase|nr:hypothetical protein [Coriobacteriales bacterium]
MSILIETAPAKLNLLLSVSRELQAGKHLLRSVFLTVNLADTLRFAYEACAAHGVHIEMRTGDESCESTSSAPSHEAIPLEDNIIYQSICMFEEIIGRRLEGALSVEVIKRIPARGGLGGGSSDAAATLRALCRLTGVDPASKATHAAAQRLGADVPFLLTGGCALMGGVGEKLERRLPEPQLDFVLAKPAAGISTRDAYAAFDADPQPELSPAQLIKALTGQGAPAPLSEVAFAPTSLAPSASEGRSATIARACANNLTVAAQTLLPELVLLRERIQACPGVLNAVLTGSGSVIFGICESRQAATEAAACLKEQGYWAAICACGLAPEGRPSDV